MHASENTAYESTVTEGHTQLRHGRQRAHCLPAEHWTHTPHVYVCKCMPTQVFSFTSSSVVSHKKHEEISINVLAMRQKPHINQLLISPIAVYHSGLKTWFTAYLAEIWASKSPKNVALVVDAKDAQQCCLEWQNTMQPRITVHRSDQTHHA